MNLPNPIVPWERPRTNYAGKQSAEISEDTELLSAERYFFIKLAVMVAENLCALRCCLSRVLFNNDTVLFSKYLIVVHILTV